jgi:hypothetical protein
MKIAVCMAPVALLAAVSLACPAHGQAFGIELGGIDVFEGPGLPAAPATPTQSKKSGKKSKEAPAEPASPVSDPTEPVADPDSVVFTLADGSKFSGKLNVKEIKLATSFGVLTIPASRITKLMPGLESRQDLGKKVEELFEKLGSPQYSDREAAEKALLALGESIREEARRRLEDKNPERVKSIKKLLDKLEEIKAETEDEGPKKDSRVLNRLDTVETPAFTAAGRISPSEFQIISKFGQLTVRLADIQSIQRPTGGAKATEIAKTVRVDGTQHIIQLGKMNTGIAIQRGDRVTLKAEGQLSMSPWGDGMSSGPDGDPNQYGWYTQNDIASGTLCAMVGSSDKPFKVGANNIFTAKRAGTLYLAIGMQQGVSGSTFPGGYNVKTRVERQ